MNQTPTYPLTPIRVFSQETPRIGGHHLSCVFGRKFWKCISTFVGMGGLVLSGCDNSSKETVSPIITTENKAPVAKVSQIKPDYEYIKIADVSPTDIGIELGMNSRDAQRILEKQGFRHFDWIGSYPVTGKCAGASEVLYYFRYEANNKQDLRIVFEADYRSKLVDGECKRVLHFVSPIEIQEKI